VLILFACFFIVLALASNEHGYRVLSHNGLLRFALTLVVAVTAAAFFLAYAFMREVADTVVRVLLTESPTFTLMHVLAFLAGLRKSRQCEMYGRRKSWLRCYQKWSAVFRTPF
jgi:hypothetical protein